MQVPHHFHNIVKLEGLFGETSGHLQLHIITKDGEHNKDSGL